MISRKFLVSLTSLAIAGLLVVPAFTSAAITQNNGPTGPHSFNKNKVKEKTVKKTKKTNTATVTNTAVITSNTGGNKVKHNTLVDGNVTSGDILVNADVTNLVNQPGEDPCCCANGEPATLDVDQDNGPTGPHSTNLNVVKKKHIEKCKIENTANVTNVAHITSNTGDNKVIGNTEVDGDVESGGVAVNLNFSNTVN